MVCPHCGETALMTGQRYCHACGATLAPRAPETATLYAVGDGSDQAMSALARQATLNWLAANKGRLLTYGVGAVVAVVAAVALLMAIVTVVFTLAAALAPFAIFFLILALAARPHRRRRRLTRIYRF